MPKSTCTVLLIFMSAIACENRTNTAPTPKASVASAQVQAGRPPRIDEDLYQPSAFMRIVELTARQERHLVYGRPEALPPGATRKDKVRLTVPHLEADRTSSLLIEYDRESLRKLEDMQVMIEARIKGRDASRNIEVKNYSVVGKPSVAASVGYIGNTPIIALRDQLRDSWEKRTIPKLNRIKSEADQAQKAKVAAALELVRTTLAALSLKIQDSVDATEALRAAEAKSVLADEAGRAALSADIAAAQKKQADAALATAAPQKAAQDARSALASAQEGTRAALEAKARELAAVVLADEATRDVFVLVTDTSTDRMLELIAASVGRPTFVVQNQLRRIAPAYRDLGALMDNNATTAAAILKAEEELESRIGGSLELLNYVPTQSDNYLRAQAAPLRNTSIDITMEGAQIGEQIIISLISEHAHKDRRTEEVNIEVTELGVAKRVADSFLFVRRRVGGDLEERLVQERQQEFRMKKGVERTLLATEVEVPVAENFSAAPGVTFGWVYIPRDDGTAFSRALRALKLGWGVNASFPSFSTKKVRITPAAEGDTITPVTVEGVTVDRQTLGLSVGIVGGVFDYALSASYGRALTVPDKRDYWALGLSFIGLAKQGRELYEKFRQQ